MPEQAQAIDVPDGVNLDELAAYVATLRSAK